MGKVRKNYLQKERIYIKAKTNKPSIIDNVLR